MLYYNTVAFKKLLFKDNAALRNSYHMMYLNRSSICKFDRSGLFTKFDISGDKFNMRSKFNLPVYDNSFALSFEDIVFKRAEEILANDKFNFFWSGGLDSTTILLAFHQYTQFQDKVKIILTDASVEDSPDIFRDIIEPNYDYVRLEKFSERKPHYSLDHMNVTGDNSECIFGWSGVLQLFLNEMGLEGAKFKLDDIPSLQGQMQTDTFREFNYWFELRNIIEETFQAAPFKIETIMELNWFFVNNFCWQYDYYRFMVPLFDDYTKVFENICPFFATDDFENWIVNNFEQKLHTLESVPNFKIDEVNFVKKYYPSIKFGTILPRKTNVELADLAPKGFLLIDDNYKQVPCPKFLDASVEDITQIYSSRRTEDEIKLLFD